MNDNDGAQARAAHDNHLALHQQLENARHLYEAKKYREALDIYLSVAKIESPAQTDIFLQLAGMFGNGRGASKDLAQAGQWFERAANAGSVQGTYGVFAVRCHQGRYTEAKDWAERAANQGFTPAIYRLGRLYEAGKGVNADRKRGRGYIEQAAAQGHLLAQRHIALSLLRGERGLTRIPRGFMMLLKVAASLFRVATQDPTSERIQR